MKIPTWFTNHKTAITASAASVCIIGAVGTAAAGAVKAEHILKQLPDDTPVRTKMLATYTAWVPPLALTVASIGLVVSQAKATSAATAAFGTAATCLADYKDEVKKVLDKEDFLKVEKSASEKRRPEPPTRERVPVAGHGGYLAYDTLSGRYFVGDREKIRSAVNDFNQMLIGGVFCTVNEWYACLDLPAIVMGDQLGWSTDRLLDVYIDGGVHEETGEPTLVIYYLSSPIPS